MLYKSSFKRIVLLLGIVFTASAICLVFSGCTPKQQPELNKQEFKLPQDNFNTDKLGGVAPDTAFFLEDSLRRVEQVKDALNSFKQLTKESQQKLAKDVLEQVGNTGWEIQTLGFYNWPNTVEGTLRVQDYKIKRLEFELAIGKYEKGGLKKEDMEQKQNAYNSAKTDLQKFLDSYSIAD